MFEYCIICIPNSYFFNFIYAINKIENLIEISNTLKKSYIKKI